MKELPPGWEELLQINYQGLDLLSVLLSVLFLRSFAFSEPLVDSLDILYSQEPRKEVKDETQLPQNTGDSQSGFLIAARLTPLGGNKSHLKYFLKDFKYDFTERPCQATDLAREAIKDGVELLVGVGGDGTANEIANGFFEEQKIINPEATLGLVPSAPVVILRVA